MSEVLKGRPGRDVLVDQFGYVDRWGFTHLARDQPMVEVGKMYLLAANLDTVRDDGQRSISAGPLAAREIESVNASSTLLAEYRQAIENASK